MYVQDTIAAISTPCGEGGIGVIRISGPLSYQILSSLFIKFKSGGGFNSHRFYYGQIVDPEAGLSIDEALAVFMASPKSFTREDVVELHCHAGTIILQRVLSCVLSSGARLAEPGEFLRRAFLNGRIDLLQAEAVIDVIRAKSDTAAQVANSVRSGKLSEIILDAERHIRSALALVEAGIDFPDEDVPVIEAVRLQEFIRSAHAPLQSLLQSYDDGRSIREGVTVMIAGKPNAGKSSLLNALLQEKRAIVTSVPGTTRDFIEEVVNISGLPVRFIDTAGIRATDDPVEAEGIRFSLEKLADVDLVVVLLDGSRPFDSDDQMIIDSLGHSRYIVVVNKSDLDPVLAIPASYSSKEFLHISTFDTESIAALKSFVSQQFLASNATDSRESVFISRARHRDLLSSVTILLQGLLDGDLSLVSGELLAVDLREALHSIGQISGGTTPDDILDLVFSQFCIGK